MVTMTMITTQHTGSSNRCYNTQKTNIGHTSIIKLTTHTALNIFLNFIVYNFSFLFVSKIRFPKYQLFEINKNVHSPMSHPKCQIS